MTIRPKNGETILFIGDSITDCGRRNTAYNLGDGYVKLFTDLVRIRESEKQVRIINKGIGGDTVLGLQNRWCDDVLRQTPDWLSIKIGINDLHNYLGQGEKGITPHKYREAYENILAQTRSTLPKCRILLITPFYISTSDGKDSFRTTVLDLLPQYIGIVESLSRKYKTRLLNTHTVFARLLEHYDPDTFCAEPVHPNISGHLVIAEAVYNVLCR